MDCINCKYRFVFFHRLYRISVKQQNNIISLEPTLNERVPKMVTEQCIGCFSYNITQTLLYTIIFYIIIEKKHVVRYIVDTELTPTFFFFF